MAFVQKDLLEAQTTERAFSAHCRARDGCSGCRLKCKYMLDSGSRAVAVHPGCPWSGLRKDWIEEVRGLAYRTKVSFCCISSSDKGVIIGIHIC